MSILQKSTLKNAFMYAVDILETVGITFGTDSAIDLLKSHGAKIDGNKVFFTNTMLQEALKTTPKCESNLNIEKKVIAASPFSNTPMILDDKTQEFRRCSIEDVIKAYQLTETSDLYECANPSAVEPFDLKSEDTYLSQIALLLKHSNKFINMGIRATATTAKNGDVYASAKAGIRLIKSFYDNWDTPIMGQGICPMAPLGYDDEALKNLDAIIEEGQIVSLFPCSLTFMTGPESLLGIVIHDIALSLAGLIYIQLKAPGTEVSFSEFSSMTDMRSLQPSYGSPENIYIQGMFYEICKDLQLPAVICGSFGDTTKVNYQSGVEATLTTLLPFALTDVDSVWCYPGHMAGFSGGSFHKAILDEEMIRYANRSLQGINEDIDPQLKDKLKESLESKSFLSIGSTPLYRKEHLLTNIFTKQGIAQDNNEGDSQLVQNIETELNNRIESYTLPQRTKEQKKLLATYLPKEHQTF